MSTTRQKVKSVELCPLTLRCGPGNGRLESGARVRGSRAVRVPGKESLSAVCCTLLSVLGIAHSTAALRIGAVITPISM